MSSTDNILAKIRIDWDGCWLWTGSKNQYSYPRYGYRTEAGKNHWLRIHRWIYEQFVGPLHRGEDVCHHCDHPLCVRPSHLFAGTAADNVRDMITKGRHCHGDRHWTKHADLKGENAHCVTLTTDQVLEIRGRFERQDGARGLQAVMAREFQVTPQTICDILKRRSWAYV